MKSFRVLSVLLCGLCLAPISQSASNIQCPADRVVVTQDGDELEYGTLPPTEPVGEPDEYDPAGLDGWYDLARGSVNAVQPENLPYDVIEDTINDNNLPCSVGLKKNCSGGEFDYQATLQDFADWWAPLIAVTVLGGVLAIVFLIVGCCFWCCRCCGLCGGARNMSDPRDWCFLIMTIILLAITLVLLVGVVLAFYSNQQSFDTIEEFKESLGDITDTAVGYVDNTLNEGDVLFCQYIRVSDLALDEADDLNNTLNQIIADTDTDVDFILEQLDSLTDGINGTGALLSDILDATQQLQSLGMALDTSLGYIESNVSSLVEECIAATLGTTCDAIPASTTFRAGANFSELPDVSQELNDVNNALAGVDLTSSIEQGRAEFDRVTQDIQEEVNRHLGEGDGSNSSSGVLSELTNVNDTIFDNRDMIVREIRKVIQDNQSIDDCPSLGDIFGGDAGDTEINAGFIRECYINQVFEQVQEYDVYRYALGIIICSLSLVIVILVLVGILLGVLGWRRDRSPDSRTGVSHCGGIILLVAVGLAFFFGFIILILASLGFFFGSNMQKICQAIEPPDYEVFTRIVDNTELWGGSLLGARLFGRDNNYTFSLSGALRACESDKALYSSLNLSNFYDVRRELLNTSDVFDELRLQLNETIDSFDYETDSFLDNETREALTNFSDSRVEAINITAFREELDAALLAFNLTESISTLTQLQDNFNATGQTDLATSTQVIIDELVDIRDNQLPAIEMGVTDLEYLVDNLTQHIDNVVMNTTRVVDDIDAVVSNITGDSGLRQQISDLALSTFDTLEYYIDSFLNHTIDAIEREVGRCRPLFNIYSEAYDVACQQTVDGLNGYWWSLGFCALLFIPLIVFAVIASTCYLRQKHPYDDDAYKDYPMKSY